MDKIVEGYAGVRYGLEHLGILTDDIDADIARLRQQGLEIFEVHETPRLRFAFVETLTRFGWSLCSGWNRAIEGIGKGRGDHVPPTEQLGSSIGHGFKQKARPAIKGH